MAHILCHEPYRIIHTLIGIFVKDIGRVNFCRNGYFYSVEPIIVSRCQPKEATNVECMTDGEGFSHLFDVVPL